MNSGAMSVAASLEEHHEIASALHEMKLLAAADALMSLSGHRRQQVWDAAALRSTPELLRDAPFEVGSSRV